ncbi:MAG: ketoacyl-ACP synthase III [Chloroflexi bacterium]|nr:ketoacyl-ACP synthase III [Chloroflexota bacterium]
MRYAQITGWGRYVPSKVMTNLDLEKLVNTSDEWIRTRTGIAERRIGTPRDTTSSMALRAAQAALQVADLPPSKVDLVIVATLSPDYPMPATASLVQDALGASRAGAFDLNAGCSGFVYALSVGASMITGGLYQTVLVIGSDTVSRFVDWTDRGTCVLFGDGAGAVVLQESALPTGLRSCILGSDGSGAESLIIPAGGARSPATVDTVEARQHFIKMGGNEVFRFAVSAMCRASLQVIKQAGLEPDEIDLIIPHQANVRIIQAAAKSLGLPMEKFFVNVDRYGNTSAASIPIALCEAIEQGRVKPGDKLLFVGFGAGLTWAASVFEWGVGAELRPAPWWKSIVNTVIEREAGVRSFALRTGRRLDAVWRRNGFGGDNGYADGQNGSKHLR